MGKVFNPVSTECVPTDNEISFSNSTIGCYAIQNHALSTNCVGTWVAKTSIDSGDIISKYGEKNFNFEAVYNGNAMYGMRWGREPLAAFSISYYEGSSQSSTHFVIYQNETFVITGGADVNNEVLFDFFKTYFTRQ